MVMKQSIKTKFLKSFLSVLIISLLLCIVLAEIGMVILRESAVSSNIEANIKTAKNSELLLTEQAINSANEFVAAKSNTINFQLQGIQKSVDMMADYLTNMLNNANECKMDNDILNVFDYRQKYIDEGVLAEREKNPEYTLHWVASNIKLYNSDEKVKLETDKQLRLLHNAKGLFASVSASYKNIATIYLTGVGINSENPNASSDNDQRDNYYNIGYDKVMLTKLSALNQYYGTTNQTSGNLPDFRTRDWYVQAVNSGKLFVSENAYDDSFGRGQIITMSKAYYENGKVKGVLCVDMQIDEINSDILQTSIGKSGYA
ncbi:MAG: cache domain-containing protein, partial [Clostridia bacterium]